MIEPRVRSVIDELEAFQKTRKDAWNVPREQGLLLHNLVLAGQCRYGVEIGTSYGFSGLFFGSALRQTGGVLHTFDVESYKRDAAGRSFEKAGLTDVITQHLGDARQKLLELPPGVDFAFIDGSKDQTMDYWRALEPRLARRCIVTVDNIDAKAREMGEFLDLLKSSDEFTYCDVLVGNGFGLAVRTG